jgi:hypothetical protein
MELMLAVAPFVSIGYNADFFIEELDRLVDAYPRETCLVLEKVLENYKPTYDFEDRLKDLLIKLEKHGERKAVLSYLDQLRGLQGFTDLFKQLS